MRTVFARRLRRYLIVVGISLLPVSIAHSQEGSTSETDHVDERATRERARLSPAPAVESGVVSFAESTRAASDAGRREADLRRAQEVAPFDLSWGLP